MSKSLPTGGQANVKSMSNPRLRLRKSKVEAKAEVEKKLNLGLNLDLQEVRKPQPLFQNLTFDI